jgi:hypothetical protein
VPRIAIPLSNESCSALTRLAHAALREPRLQAKLLLEAAIAANASTDSSLSSESAASSKISGHKDAPRRIPAKDPVAGRGVLPDESTR